MKGVRAKPHGSLEMTNLKFTKILAAIVTVTGCLVMLGWFANITILTSILPQWVTMKFSTALCFALSGVTLFLVATALEGKTEIAKVFIPIGVSGILLLMASLLASTLLNIRTGIEDLFIEEISGSVKTTTPGRPSVGTMVEFILVAVGGILTMVNATKFRPILPVLGWIVGLIGVLALIGYVTNMDILYYTWEGTSTAMAIHTAILFVCLGMGLIFVGKRSPAAARDEKQESET